MRRRSSSPFRERRIPYGRHLGVVVAVLVAIVVAAAFVFGGREPDPIPGSPAAEHLRWIVASMNDSSALDAEAIRERFAPSVIASSSIGRLVERISVWDERSDGYRVAQVVDGDDEHRIEVLVTNGQMDWGRVVVETDAEPPYPIVRFTIERADPPDGVR